MTSDASRRLYAPEFARSLPRTLYRNDQPPIEYRRVFQQPAILHLEHRELKPDGRPHDNNWYPVTDAHLLHMQRTDAGAAALKWLADLPFVGPKPTGGSAFPSELDCSAGMTLRDHFATHAPAEIPTWFKHVEPPKNFPPLPSWQAGKNQHDKDMLRAYLDDGGFDLPAEYAWFSRDVEMYRAGKAAWDAQNHAARYIQWRWHYADLMIAGRA